MGKLDWMGSMESIKPLIMTKIPQASGSVIPPNRADKKTSPKIDVLMIKVLQNMLYCHTGKSLDISFIHILLPLTQICHFYPLDFSLKPSTF